MVCPIWMTEGQLEHHLERRQAARRKRSSHLEHHPISAFLYLKDSMKFFFPSHSCSPFETFSQYHNEDCSGPMVTGSCLFLGFPNLSVNLCEPVCPLGETVIELKTCFLIPLQTSDPKEKTDSARDVLSVSFPHLLLHLFLATLSWTPTKTLQLLRPPLFTVELMIKPDCEKSMERK